MSEQELIDIQNKLEILEKFNPKKFEQFKGRLDALCEIENEKNDYIKSVWFLVQITLDKN